ncbi:acetyl-CoA carboxylase biotin carboxyl carrier protein [Lentilactobacillus hilgardii]|uniref:Biotin carboxyl carrier protein of acetyl-CoA carboxylase n=1 Tax=Lentilactobacillus hilgardii (strain ATCC 8290 / DSM 20176 / CCUG 30140 / JCM 1155 / KCTC 3500 / NBRC 15886 / NCIMB 8040 / NRRL B-1843 / 9) TaxID=1423757 RepID=C0XHQ3_LENH9|nr:acetyl-CoA carboxylase biotin carboxyl carrier protein [Lentilactobacillus hilgardii]EEI19239.1 acetyl-CoA carboxylase, biotin carboxyl carrier protein [Lentilactobacillus buchneri ATCC 11577]EEI25185.1 acetyl-CoA carboxylase, biotin carboxyl carrier protein [Lentilactobacillus hilgardii DSM 20176 = ATCC 8290]KRK59320.1 acetyl-CoA carboxylase biotin carboxyl carrier subunit [Lentilactobacillus hilgardii DSM 20176 = ATCC 8290]MCP9333011.1 acetyl-CoA carboxylase biotin carboxyl carrier protein
MDEKEIERLLDKFDKSSLKNFELTQDDFKLALSKREGDEQAVNDSQATGLVGSDSTHHKQNSQSQSAASDDLKSEGTDSPDNVEEITAPLVGVIYFAPNPDKPAFKKQGDKVKKGDVVCVIEAMKMINEVKSDVSGTISNVLVKDGSMVEYGQPIFQVTKG